MKDFEFSFPTQIMFGTDAEEKIGTLSEKYGHRAMIIYGSERIRNNGLYDRLAAKLEEHGVTSLPFGGIAENPRLIKVDEGIDLVRNNEIDLLLAVGGGECYRYNEGDQPWKLLSRRCLGSVRTESKSNRSAAHRCCTDDGGNCQ